MWTATQILSRNIRVYKFGEFRTFGNRNRQRHMLIGTLHTFQRQGPVYRGCSFHGRWWSFSPRWSSHRGHTKNTNSLISLFYSYWCSFCSWQVIQISTREYLKNQCITSLFMHSFHFSIIPSRWRLWAAVLEPGWCRLGPNTPLCH